MPNNSKELKFDLKAKAKLLKGINVVANTVGSTLGPKANNVAIERPWGPPMVLHDGVGVAREIELEDRFENVGAQLIKEAAGKTNDMAGDGTTTATILTKSIVTEALQNIAAGANPMIIKKGIEKARDAIVKELGKMAKEVKSDEEIRQIAEVSAQNPEIGNLIYKAHKKLGHDCAITTEEGGTEMTLEYKEGMEFNKGWVAFPFITNIKNMESIVKNPIILISDFKIDTMPEFLRFLDNWDKMPADQKSGSNLVIICDEATGNPLRTLITNKVQGNIKVNVITAPGHGDERKELLEDIAVITGGKVMSVEAGDKIDKIEPEAWGRAGSVISTKDSTMIVDGRGREKAVKFRVTQLKDQLKKSDSEIAKERLKERIAKLTTGIAVIEVGANSEAEMKEKKERCIDAINATQAAIEEGIVPGGEVALLNAADRAKRPELYDDELVGYNLVIKAIHEPFRVLMENSGHDSGQMLERLENCEQDLKIIPNAGIDVMDGQIKDMMEAGIVDPVKVTRSALQNAVSSAIMIFTTNTIITTIPQENPPQPGAPQGMM